MPPGVPRSAHPAPGRLFPTPTHTPHTPSPPPPATVPRLPGGSRHEARLCSNQAFHARAGVRPLPARRRPELSEAPAPARGGAEGGPTNASGAGRRCGGRAGAGAACRSGRPDGPDRAVPVMAPAQRERPPDLTGGLRGVTGLREGLGPDDFGPHTPGRPSPPGRAAGAVRTPCPPPAAAPGPPIALRAGAGRSSPRARSPSAPCGHAEVRRRRGPIAPEGCRIIVDSYESCKDLHKGLTFDPASLPLPPSLSLTRTSRDDRTQVVQSCQEKVHGEHDKQQQMREPDSEDGSCMLEELQVRCRTRETVITVIPARIIKGK